MSAMGPILIWVFGQECKSLSWKPQVTSTNVCNWYVVIKRWSTRATGCDPGWKWVQFTLHKKSGFPLRISSVNVKKYLMENFFNFAVLELSWVNQVELIKLKVKLTFSLYILYCMNTYIFKLLKQILKVW